MSQKTDIIADAVLELAELFRLFAQRMKRSLVRPEVDETVMLLERRLRALCDKISEA